MNPHAVYPGAPAASITHLMAMHGRGGDDHVGHLSAGDLVVPREVVLKDPAILTRVKKLMEDDGDDYRSHLVGSGHERHNPTTGAPEFFSLKSIFKSVAPILGGVLGSVGGPLGSAAGSALGSLVTGGGVKGAALSGVGSYLGGQFLGSGSGDLAGNLSQSGIPGAGGLADSLAGTALGGVGVNALTGSLAGQSIAGLVGGSGAPQPAAQDLPGSGVSGPKDAALPTSAPKAASLPSGLSSFAGLDPLQQGTGIATQGLYGGGAGKDENDYFINLLQRQLIDDKGGYNDYSSNVNPTEEGYLHNGLGLQFDPNTQSLLQAISNKQAAQSA